jgi:hypothetical protein
MIKYYTLLIIGFLSSSCATLIHQRTVDLNVHSDADSVKICVNKDTTRWYNTPTWINVERSRNDLLIIAKRDSVQKMIQVNSKLSTAFWLGNMFSGIGIFGYAIDLTNPKRFTYPSNITINFQTNSFSTKSYRTWLTPEKGLLAFKISIPEGNHFYINKGNGYGNSFGFLGISGGLEYYLTDKYSISSDIGALTDFMIPFPAPVDYWGPHESSSAVYGNIQIGSDISRLHYGAGLQYNKTFYNKWDTIPSTPEHYSRDTLSIHKVQNNFGIALSTYYRISNGFNVGLSYYPSFLTWDIKGLDAHYSHLIFFELIFRLEAFRPRK